MALNEGQQAAFNAFKRFQQNPDSTVFALFGAAGTGKSFLSGQMAQEMTKGVELPAAVGGFFGPQTGARLPSPVMWTAPTWKAARISSGFLSNNGIDHEVGWDKYFHSPYMSVVTTTAQALGIGPIVSEDQNENERAFGARTEGAYTAMGPEYLVIDEVSMLGWGNLKRLANMVRGREAKLVLIGDPNQIPPVKDQEIKWDKIENQYELTQIMRQSGDSVIPLVGRAIIEEADWRSMRGQGFNMMRDQAALAQEFLQTVTVPTRDESGRTVYVAYRNMMVDAMQEKACQQVYGHGRDMFERGQIVIAQKPLRGKGKQAIANQDVLEIREFGERGRWGKLVSVEDSNGRVHNAEYLSGDELADKSHPYNVELETRRQRAVELQQQYKGGNRTVNEARKEAWRMFFELKDNTVLNFAHPFAITSHKSQGSTYQRAFVHGGDLERFGGKRALYVAMTRASDETFAC
jgi:exodeoxyribonuclease-5